MKVQILSYYVTDTQSKPEPLNSRIAYIIIFQVQIQMTIDYVKKENSLKSFVNREVAYLPSAMESSSHESWNCGTHP